MQKGSYVKVPGNITTKIKDKIGKKFGSLTVLDVDGFRQGKRDKYVIFLCLCDCGNTTVVHGLHLGVGTKSCGCLAKKQRENWVHGNIKYEPIISSARNIWKFYKKEGLSFDDFFNMSQLPCFYCGIAPYNTHNAFTNSKRVRSTASEKSKAAGTFIYNGLDRIDSTKGHIKGNLVPCCILCNWAKRDMTQADFYTWAYRLSDNLRKNNRLL
jgi:hypothetical protein